MAAPTSHVVLAIDNSRSMETADVEEQGYARGHKMRRCDAVQWGKHREVRWRRPAGDIQLLDRPWSEPVASTRVSLGLTP